jgi:predicted transcriptional regulator
MKLKKIDIGIKGLEESLQDFARAWKALESGKRIKLDKGIYFDSIDDMRSVLTNNRLLIIKAIRKHRPKSIYELAKHLRRDLKNVNQDLRLLSDIGLVTLEATEIDRKRLIPLVDYKKIVLGIAV